MGSKDTLNITIDKTTHNALKEILEEKIKITDKSHINAFSNKSQLIDYLLKLGLIQYKESREKDETGTIL
ncbi:hypothetical protein DRN76_04895 [Methanosarcinales archaeon]|nr:MAG: hypothetical protein DRN76_04895 [Methanosarcinales archaeon]